MFDNLKNLSGLLGSFREMKAKMEQVQAELGSRTVDAEAGAGAVRVTVNGRLEVVAVRLDPVMIRTLAGGGDDADRQMIEDLITAATNAALARARELIQEEMSKATGGLNVPGLDKLLGGEQG